MQYVKGSTGRIFVIRFDNGDNLLESLKELIEKEEIKAGIIHIIGGMRKGNIVVGPEKDEIPPKPVWKDINEPREIVATGTIFWQSGKPAMHIHGATGRLEDVSIGCMRESVEVFLIMEAVIIEITDINAEKVYDPLRGLSVLNFENTSSALTEKIDKC